MNGRMESDTNARPPSRASWTPLGSWSSRERRGRSDKVRGTPKGREELAAVGRQAL